MKSLFISIFLIVVCITNSNAQKDSTDRVGYIISGTVVAGNTNNILSGAHLISSSGYATKTNESGSFNLNVFEGDTLSISFVGYKTYTYSIPSNLKGKYLTKFILHKDSISLQEVEIFPWPTYAEFKKTFKELNFKDQEIKMEGVKLYQDRNVEAYNFTTLHLLTNPLSFIYDKLLDKKAKTKRRVDRRRATIRKSNLKQSLEY